MANGRKEEGFMAELPKPEVKNGKKDGSDGRD
jgi:hypothetical protein